MQTVVTEVFQETPKIFTITLSSKNGEPLPTFEPGAHIDVHLPGNIIRQYSLCPRSDDDSEYRIAVKLQEDSRGGSAAIHRLQAGDEIEISEPRNNFELVDGAARYLLIAAGIDIAPIYGMARRLHARGDDFAVIYFARSSDEAALVSELALVCPDQARMVFGSNRRDEQPFFYRDLLEGTPANTHVYICEPQGFMDTAHGVAAKFVPSENIHIERFEADEKLLAGSDPDGPFIVEFEGQYLEIPAHKSILEVFDEADIPVLSSCEEGTCGNCMMICTQGTVDHRDSVFSAAQHAEGRMATCVSRAKTPKITLERYRKR